jgi:hypothetical protein
MRKGQASDRQTTIEERDNVRIRGIREVICDSERLRRIDGMADAGDVV